jgi:hypothetical protein
MPISQVNKILIRLPQIPDYDPASGSAGSGVFYFIAREEGLDKS